MNATYLQFAEALIGAAILTGLFMTKIRNLFKPVWNNFHEGEWAPLLRLVLAYIFLFAGISQLFHSGSDKSLFSLDNIYSRIAGAIEIVLFVGYLRLYRGGQFFLFASIAGVLIYIADHFFREGDQYAFVFYMGQSALSAFMGFLTIVTYQFGTHTRGSGSEGNVAPTRTAVRARFTFSDVVGMNEFKSRLLKAGREIVASTKKSGWFSKPNIEDARNGILLTGDPGNGKTFLAEALAGELKLPFVSFTGGDVTSRWVGQTTEQLISVFNEAVRCAPSLLFIDEIDSLLPKRENIYRGDSEANTIANTILTKLVELRAQGVVIVAATNFIDKLDTAGIREGRFDFKIEVPPPDLEARVALFRRALTKKIGKKAIGFDPAAIHSSCERWDGFSVSRIRAIAEETAITAKYDGVNAIAFEDIQKALRKIQGSLGTRLKDSDPTLEQLTFAPRQKLQIEGLARRMINPREVERLGGTVPTGALFSGPAGTGKTSVAKALAKTTGWAFLSTSGQDLLSSPEKIDKLLADAANMRPCIVFIDEADDVLGDRMMSPHTKPITNKLLIAIDGDGGRSKDILFIAATNNPQTMDSAALRGGRFTEKVEFILPDRETVAAFVADWIKGSKAKISPDLAPATIAGIIGNVAPANVKAIMQAAVNHWISRDTAGVGSVTAEDILIGRDTVLSGV